ncbi:MAG TPA: peptidoglycan editing factor PgeF [Alphaproteobacteria bacterium]|jgi:YfiH family protein|nr:peptidoglycan editing factor PgeF [Alphaproteobacteria bacterium]
MTMKAPELAALQGVGHSFFTRQGGISAGIYASLNCGLGSGDDPEHVAENRARAAAALGVEAGRLVTAYQVHGNAVAEVDTPWTPGNGPHVDAMVTNRRGIGLGILTADCTPVLLADPKAGVIGAAHAGWKGAKAGVVDTVVAAMVRLGAAPTNIIAAVGPTIGQASYEVGEGFREAFLADDPAAAAFFMTPPDGKPHFDLPGFVVRQLQRLGLAAVGRLEADTCADPDRFFSYRRSCHLGEGDYGRQLSAIALI